MKLVIFLAAVVLVAGDLYMHHPPGSNDRLNEKSANRNNANRVFDSQNNNRGGYNVGVKTSNAQGNNANTQYSMQYFMSDSAADGGKTEMLIEWTNQHGCGGNEDTDPNKLNCNVVIQYMCRPESTGNSANRNIRDGTTTNTPEFRESSNERDQNSGTFDNNKRKSEDDLSRVYQEPYEWYNKCKTRERNKGLFTADQKVKRNDATGTRQNPGGTRRGLECPEERDYYPYWHPSDWKDIVILAENTTICDKVKYVEESFNSKVKHECVENYYKSNTPRHWSKHNNEAACKAAGGTWTAFTNYLEKYPSATNKAACEAVQGVDTVWGRPLYEFEEQCLVKVPPVECKASPWSRVNHLGNGKEGETLSYLWKLPHFPSGDKQRCVLRMRYNISTDDYDPWRTDSKSNQNSKAGTQSPVTNNPQVEVGGNIPLQLAINTAQFGRTFQDRSHRFDIIARPAAAKSKDILILSKRGKRGNIVQTFPAVEYDFVPTNLVIEDSSKQLVHITWTGSNTHNNGNPQGDGQKGDDGEGTGGTDRTNMVQIPNRNENFPTPLELGDMFENTEVVWMAKGNCAGTTAAGMTELDIQLMLGSSGYFGCKNELRNKNALNNQLNNASPTFEGALLRFKSCANKKYHYICSRNNNFTNRSQKGTIHCKK